MLRSAKDIEVGDSKDVVLDKMGKPTMEHFIDADYGTLFKVEYKYDWWAYGKIFTLKNAFFGMAFLLACPFSFWTIL